MKRIACALVLVLASLASAQNLTISGETVVVVKSLPFRVTAPAGADDYVWLHPSSVTSTEDGNVLVITAAPQGEVTVKCRMLAIDFKAQKVTRSTAALTFVVGKQPDPGPGPGPKPPDPPAPEDPLLATLRDAYRTDPSTSKRADALALAKVWRAAANDEYLKRAGTWKDLLSAMSGAAQLVVKDRLHTVRAALAAETRTLVPDLGASCTNGGAVKAKALLVRFADLLEAVAKE